MFGYRVPAPDQAMLISGGKGLTGTGGSPFRVVIGHGAFVPPFVRKVRFLTLAMCEAEVAEACVTRQAIALNVRASSRSADRGLREALLGDGPGDLRAAAR
jgi:flotillin